MVLEKTLESPLDCKAIQSVHSEGDQPWDFFGRNYAKAETPVLWPPHAKSWLIGKDSDAGRDWGQEEKGTTEDEMAGWHHWLNGHESEWTSGLGDGQGGLACCNSWLPKSQTRLSNWTELNWRNVDPKKKKVCPFLLLENSRSLSHWGPPDFLSTYLGIDSLTFLSNFVRIFLTPWLYKKESFCPSLASFHWKLFHLDVFFMCSLEEVSSSSSFSAILSFSSSFNFY